MERSGSQKVLLVVSILSIIVAALGILASLAMMVGGSLVGAMPTSEAAEALSGSGVTQGEAGAILGVFGIIILLGCVLELVVGILGVRAANDNQKIMPVWVLALIEVILYVISLVMVFMNGSFGSDGLSTILSLLVAILLFWIANNIKREAGK